MEKKKFNIGALSLSDKNYYAVSNILQSIENARIYCSYFESHNNDLRYELEYMIENFKQKVQKKINENF